MKNNKLILIVILLAAGVWWNFFNLKEMVNQWTQAPGYFSRNMRSFFSDENLMKIQEVRWNAFGEKREDILSKIYYNKGYIIVDNFFSYVSYFMPRSYFQAGDGTRFSPKGVEPIAGILFPFWVIGLISIVKDKNFKPLYLVLGISLFAFLLGQRNLAFLFPVMLVYIYIAAKSLGKKQFIFVLVYALFVIGRVIWLKS